MSNSNYQVHELLKPNKVEAKFQKGEIVVWQYRNYTVGLRFDSGFYTKEYPELYLLYQDCKKFEG